MAAPRAASTAPLPEAVADLHLDTPWSLGSKARTAAHAPRTAGMEPCSGMLPEQEPQHRQRAASLGPDTPSEALERPSAAPHAAACCVSRSASPEHMRGCSAAPKQAAVHWRLLHAASRLEEAPPEAGAGVAAAAPGGLAGAEQGQGAIMQQPEQAGCEGEAGGKDAAAATQIVIDKAAEGAGRPDAGQRCTAEASQGRCSREATPRADGAAARDSSRAAGRGAARRSPEDPARGSSHNRGVDGRSDDNAVRDSGHASRHRSSSRDARSRGVGKSREPESGREARRRREPDSREARTSRGAARTSRDPDRSREPVCSREPHSSREPRRSREPQRSREPKGSSEPERSRTRERSRGAEDSRQAVLNRLTGQARRALGTVAECAAQLSATALGQLRALKPDKQIQAAHEFADGVRRAQKGGRELRPDAWLAHFVACQERGLVLSSETRAALDALLGGRRLNAAERTQLLPEEQAGLLQQLAAAERRAVAKRIANPCGWLAATAKRIRQGALTTAWQLPPPPRAAAAAKLPASPSPRARPCAAAAELSPGLIAAPAAHRPREASAEACAAGDAAAVRPSAPAAAAAELPGAGPRAGRVTDRTARLVRQATRAAAGRRPGAGMRADAARGALIAASRQPLPGRDADAQGRPLLGAAAAGTCASPASAAAVQQGAAREDVGAAAPGRHKRKLSDQPEASLEAREGVPHQADTLTPPKGLRRQRWGPVAAATVPPCLIRPQLPHAEAATMGQPGPHDATMAEAEDAAHADEGGPPGAPLLQADPGFANLGGAVQAVLLALVRARLLRDGGLGAACLAELAALPPQEQHEARHVAAELDECLTTGRLAQMPARIVQDRIQDLQGLGAAGQPDIPSDIKASLYGLLDEGRASGRMRGCLDAVFHRELAASSRAVQLDFLKDFCNAVRKPKWSIAHLQGWACKAIARHRQEATAKGLPATAAAEEAGPQGAPQDPPPSWALTMPRHPSQQPLWQRQNWDVLCGSQQA